MANERVIWLTPELMASALAPEGADRGEEFVLLLIDESVSTDDGRSFEVGGITWREPPLTLMYMPQTSPEGKHFGAVPAGTISRIWRTDTEVWGAGYYASDEAGEALRIAVAEKTVTGVSSDILGVTKSVSADEMGNVFEHIWTGKIGGATVLPFPAFPQTRIQSITASGEECNSCQPPVSWFTNPNFQDVTPLTITESGQVFGHVAQWGQCHIGFPDTCRTAPKSRHDYGFFTTGKILTAEGQEMPVGQITLGTGHADRAQRDPALAAAHYDNTGTAVADVAAGEDAFGIWISGSLRDDIDIGRIAQLRASSLSGDWRPVDSGLEMVAVLAVNVPGFPIPRPAATLADNEVVSLVAAGVVDREQVSESFVLEGIVASVVEAPVEAPPAASDAPEPAPESVPEPAEAGLDVPDPAVSEVPAEPEGESVADRLDRLEGLVGRIGTKVFDPQ